VDSLILPVFLSLTQYFVQDCSRVVTCLQYNGVVAKGRV